MHFRCSSNLWEELHGNLSDQKKHRQICRNNDQVIGYGGNRFLRYGPDR